MTDTKFSSQSAAGGDTQVDNELVTTSAGVGLIRQRVRLGGAVGTALVDAVSSVGTALGHLFTGTANERADGTITAASSLGGASAQGITGAEGQAASTIRLVPTMGHSSWTVQVSGTWVGTMVTEVTAAPDPTAAGAYWVAVNSRQSQGGRLANNFTVSGLFRGAFGGVTGIRVRATALASGTATVAIVTGQSGAVFQNSDVVIQEQHQYYASSAGLNTLWGSASPATTLGNANVEQSLLMVSNNGTNPLYIYRLSMGCNNTSVFRRYRTAQTPIGSAPATQMTYTSGGTALVPVNRAGAQSVATSATVRYGTGIVVANQPSIPSRTVFVPGGGQDTENMEGSIIIPVGQSLLFTVSASVNNSLATCEVVYWDGSSLT